MIETKFDENEYENNDAFTEEEREFVIDSAEKAMWGLGKIKEMRNARDYYINACKSEIERLKEEIRKTEDKCERETSWLLFKLDSYLDCDDVPVKTTKTQKSLKLPNGSIVRKLPKIEIVDVNGNVGAKLKTNEDLISVVGDEYKKVYTELDWAKLKKHLVINDGMVMTDEGEIIECLQPRETLPSVDVKFD